MLWQIVFMFADHFSEITQTHTHTHIYIMAVHIYMEHRITKLPNDMVGV